MIRRLHRRIALTSLAGVLAVAMSAPRAVWACDAVHDHKCCCQATDSQPAPLTECISRSCPCCQPAVPLNLPPERVALQIPLDFAALSGLIATASNPVVCSAAIDTAPANDFVAVPHRILHCTWLI